MFKSKSPPQSARPTRNLRFFETIYAADPWAGLKARDYRADDNSMFGDADVVRSVIEAVRPEFIVEIGSWKGHSANFMAEVSKQLGLKNYIICVDTFLGSSEHWLIPDLYASMRLYEGRPTVYKSFIGNTLVRQNEDRVLPLPVDSLAASSILGELGFEADLIFIDGAHDYESVLRDVTRFHALLAPGGVLFGDDYQEQQVGRAVHDFADRSGLLVGVCMRKWMYVSPKDGGTGLPDGFVLRTTRDGWIHP